MGGSEAIYRPGHVPGEGALQQMLDSLELRHANMLILIFWKSSLTASFMGHTFDDAAAVKESSSLVERLRAVVTTRLRCNSAVSTKDIGIGRRQGQTSTGFLGRLFAMRRSQRLG
jgi:hypothetical protein